MPRIVRATPELAGALTAIALAGKRHWRYPERWIEAWTPQLTVSEAYVAAHPTFAMIAGGSGGSGGSGSARSAEIAGSGGSDAGGGPVGFYALVPGDGGRVQLDHLWLLPDWIGRGLGRILFEHALACAAGLGADTVWLEAEPNAEPFYRHMGARRAGRRVTEIEGTARVLPLLEIDLSDRRCAASFDRRSAVSGKRRSAVSVKRRSAVSGKRRSAAGGAPPAAV
jgi:GNAT superfamily N-acetyltransferase